METNQIRYFLAICEEGSFTGAARRCGVSQPSVSNAIKLLEEEFGGSLFRRAARGTQLSPLGAAMHPWFERINTCTENARRTAAEFPPADALGSTPTTMENTMRNILYVTAAVILIAGLFLEERWPNIATASLAAAPGTIEVGALSAAIDMKSLPRQDLAPEVYQ
ncbi:MAG TPA: LysR family transcriptional regulator [Acidobacteriota bacterium]|nr:LysR family transcriptional regulator [Pseudolabrys sp.]HYA28785.1 LysR family transcriptional regulator [Acidobacteriota bacterium]